MKKISKNRDSKSKGGSKRTKAKRKSTIKIVDLLIFLMFAVLTGLLIVNIIKLSNIENLIRIIVMIVLGLILVAMVVFRKKKRALCRIIMIVLCLVYIFLNYAFYRIYASLDSITTKVDTKGICLVTSLEEVETIEDITDDDIAIIDSAMDLTFYEMAEGVLNAENLKNDLMVYEDYFQIIGALLDGEVKYAFLPENYSDIYKASSGDDTEELDFNVLYSEQKVIENNGNNVQTKDLGEPFTILLMGTDVILDSYNADTLMVLTVNPKTMKVTMLSIPRDTYTTIACTGGKHKINSSGWYGDSCVVRTVENYLDIDIDYYAKINFLGIVDLVDDLGGIDVDVPYAFCEQNSKREFGSSMIYVDAGNQTLNGEQALALSRNRHYWTGMCDAKYTTDGNRNDITRGENQQLVIKAILSKLMTVRDLNKFYDILDTVGDNMTTNMSRETILSFYNIGKEIVKRFNASDAEEIINIDRLTFKSYSTNILISGLQLSMIVNYNESVEYVSNEMKKNLGLVEEKVVTTFSFDVNETYDPDTVKYNKLTSNLELLQNFVGKTLEEAISYCNKNGLKYESNTNELSAIITVQSIGANTDISTIKNKTINFEIEIGTNVNSNVEDNSMTGESTVPKEDNTTGDMSDDQQEDSGMEEDNNNESGQETPPSDESDNEVGEEVGDGNENT